MKTKLNLEQFVTILIIVAFAFGLIIGLSNNQYQKKLKLYEQYYINVEAVLDRCDEIHNICDTVMEEDVYQDYVDIREKLDLE